MATISITQTAAFHWLLCGTCKHTDHADDVLDIVQSAQQHIKTQHDDGKKHRVTMDLAHAVELRELVIDERMNRVEP